MKIEDKLALELEELILLFEATCVSEDEHKAIESAKSVLNEYIKQKQ